MVMALSQVVLKLRDFLAGLFNFIPHQAACSKFSSATALSSFF
jgi:hypothetical protein